MGSGVRKTAVSLAFAFTLVVGGCLLRVPTSADAGDDSAPFTIEEYNATLPIWGTSWAPGARAINGYYPTFYTGFAPRSENPSRIHVRIARGNQTRVSVILDDETLRDYLYDLVKRYRFYERATRGSRPLVDVNPDPSRSGPRALPQLESFRRVVESDAYGILAFVDGGRRSPEEIHAKSLDLVARLNPGRVFPIRLDLARAFTEWRSRMRALLEGKDPAASFTAKTPATVLALETLLPGRVNVVETPSAELLSLLAETARAAIDPSVSAADFVPKARALFEAATPGRYAFRTYSSSGGWRPAIDCPSADRCVLAYPEFTSIYPTGTMIGKVSDEHGNAIPDFATPGLWKFVSRGSRAVDNIREEPYYGWAPKMDYEAAGNGFHNPAVRFWGISRAVRDQLNIPARHEIFWSVKRGGVSHGCSRLPLGHVWEMRHLFPVEDRKMTEVRYFGSAPRDFDVYDVDGDGRPEVMGVEYLISYGLREAGGLGSREGTDLEIGKERKLAFYETLYGARNVFRPAADGGFLFHSPGASLPSYLDLKRKRVSARLVFPGEVPLYEQPYERDKVQYYLPIGADGLTLPGAAPLGKRIVRLMGRVRGCAPTADREACGEAAFDREAAAIFAEAGASP